MATAAASYDQVAAGVFGREASRAGRGSRRLPPLPNEDVFLYVKAIDNSRVARKADPAARRSCWKAIGLSSLGALMVIGILLPHAYGLLAGYQIQGLRQDQERLAALRAGLEVDEAALLSAERLAELAETQNLVDPPAERIVYLNPKADGSLALNVGAQ